jgi:hypothetical protein
MGERRRYYKSRGILFQSAKGAQRVDGLCAPTPLLKCPHTRKEKIEDFDDEIAAEPGRKSLPRFGGAFFFSGVGSERSTSLVLLANIQLSAP